MAERRENEGATTTMGEVFFAYHPGFMLPCLSLMLMGLVVCQSDIDG